MRLREDRALEAFAVALEISDGQPGVITARPDRDGAAGGADAIIRRLGRDWAVEHTTIDSFPGQREDNDRLRRVFGPAREAIAEAYPALRITLGVPLGAVPTKTSWARITSTYSELVIAALQDHGDTPGNRLVTLPGMFDSHIFFRRSRSPGCFLSREIDSSDLDGRVGVIVSAIESKHLQLAPYRAAGMPTALLLDNDDVGLMSPDALAEAFTRASSIASFEDLDDVYLVDAVELPPWIYPLKLGPRSVPDLPEFKHFFDEQYRRGYEQ
jgi:hypothetical protein